MQGHTYFFVPLVLLLRCPFSVSQHQHHIATYAPSAAKSSLIFIYTQMLFASIRRKQKDPSRLTIITTNNSIISFLGENVASVLFVRMHQRACRQKDTLVLKTTILKATARYDTTGFLGSSSVFTVSVVWACQAFICTFKKALSCLHVKENSFQGANLLPQPTLPRVICDMFLEAASRARQRDPMLQTNLTPHFL